MQTEDQNFNTLFYGELPKDLTKISKNLLEKLGSVDRSLFDIFTLQKWIITFYYEINKKEFSEFCETHSTEQITTTFTKIFDQIRLEELCAYFPIVVKKYQFNKYHFRNRKYIPHISSKILTIMNNRHHEGFDFPQPKNFHSRYSDDYHWLVWNFSPEHLQSTGFKKFLYDCKFELRRNYFESCDDPIFENTGLEKVVYSIMVQNNVVHLCDDFPEAEADVIMTFLEELNKETPITLNFDVVSPIDYDIIIELCYSLNLDAPLKLYAYNDKVLKEELWNHFKRPGNITINYYGHVIFNINKDNLFDLLDYVYHEFDKRAIKAISQGYTYSNIQANTIWNRLIRHEILAHEYGFERSEENIKFFKRYYVNDTMLKEALKSVSMQSSIEELKEFIIKDFKLYRDFETNNYYLDIFPYIKSLLNHHDADYVLPKNGWKIFEDYFHVFDRVFFTDYYEIFNRDEFSINVVEKDIEDITLKLIENLNKQYSKALIEKEMQD